MKGGFWLHVKDHEGWFLVTRNAAAKGVAIDENPCLLGCTQYGAEVHRKGLY
jgi:hypothetical protein